MYETVLCRWERTGRKGMIGSHGVVHKESGEVLFQQRGLSNEEAKELANVFDSIYYDGYDEGMGACKKQDKEKQLTIANT